MESVYCGNFASFCSKLCDGDLAGLEAKNEIRILGGIRFYSRAIVGSLKGGWVVDLTHEVYLSPILLQILDSELRRVNAIQASLNDWVESGRARRLVYSIWKSCFDGWWVYPSEEEFSEVSNPSYAVVVSAVVLLSLVYQYLTGNVDIGSSKAYSRSSLDFRDIYVAIVLFLGAYVWIKFREVAFKGVCSRKIVHKRGQITKVVFEPRFKPPRENGKAFEWIYLGQYATPEEASILYQIAAFYYKEGQGGSLDLGDGRWFSLPPMSEAQRSLSGAEKRAWVKVQAMKVYKDFREAEKAEAALLQELLVVCEDQATPRQDEHLSEASLLNSGEPQLPLLLSPAENSGMATAMLDDPGLECASQSFGGMHEIPYVQGFVTSTGHSLGFEEESAIIPIPQRPPDAQSGMGINNSNQLNFPQIVQNQQELITYLRQQLEESQGQNSVLQNQHCIDQQQLEEFRAQISVLQNQQRIQQQQLEESRIRISQLESQNFVHQQLQVINEGVSGFQVEMEPSMPQQNHPCRPHGSVFW